MAKNRIEQIFEFQIILFIIGLFFSQFLLSVSTICIVLTAIVTYYINRQHTPFSWSNYLKDYQYSALSLLFVCILISGLNSENTTEWLHHIKMKAIFVFLPWSFYFMKLQYGLNYRNFFFTLILISFISTIPVLYHYVDSFTLITKSLGKGHYIPTSIDHIIYSLILAFSSLSAFILSYQNRNDGKKWTIAMLLIGIYLTAVLHVMAVRSGIVTFYVGASITLLLFIIAQKKYLVGGLLMSLLFIGPVIAYKVVPSFHKKIHYMLYDIDMYKKGDASHYSDSGRLYSLQVGYSIWSENKIIGTGIGDLKNTCTDKYNELFKLDNKLALYPHNQYVFILAGTGLMGFVIFIIGLLAPLLCMRNYYNILLLNIYAIFLSSFLVNNSIERSVGASFLCLCIMLAIEPRTSNEI